MATILIVDDVSANRDVLLAILSHEGHTLVEAADGREGLKAVRTAHPDLVISDVLMPAMDGYEFVRQIRLEAAIAATPVVFYTAHYGERDARALALAGGVSDVLTKPVKAAEVLRVVGRVLSTGSGVTAEPEATPLTTAFDREHLRLVTDKLSEKAGDLRSANARLRALINIGLELASERDADRLLQGVCAAACDLFGAASVALGMVDIASLTVDRIVTAGASDAASWIEAGDALSGILRTVVVERRTLRGDNGRGGLANLPFPSRRPDAAFLAAPIASPSQVHGWICLTARQGRVFTDNDEELVMALSGLVGRIYEHSHLVVVAQQRVAELSREVLSRRQAEEALHKTERLMRSLVEHLPHRILVKDRESAVLFCNANYARGLGLSPEDVIGTTTSALYGRELAAAYMADDQAVIASGIAKSLEEPYAVAGQPRWVHTVKLPYRDEEGAIVGVIVLLEDITDRRALEAQFQQAVKMEVIGQLASGIAHDFNNLLTVTLGLCGLLLADHSIDAVHRADIAEIQTVSARAAELTRQLLAFSRKQIIEPKRLDLNEVVNGMRTMLERLIRADVSLIVRLQPDPAPVHADRGQLEQIIMNLAVNARDAMPEGGTLTIETADVELDGRDTSGPTHLAPGAYVALTIRDTGIGMTPEVQARLFEPFFTTKEAGKGTGLGLATVQGIVARSDARVTVASEVGKGSSFTIHFPRSGEPEPIAAVPPGTTAPRSASETILVVDDDIGLRDLIRRLLERQGYTVFAAGSATAAAATFDRHPGIDVLLTDVVMPGANGLEPITRLIERHPGLKVIYMSSYAENTIAPHGVLSPGIAFVHKPFTSETLGRKVREVLDL